MVEEHGYFVAHGKINYMEVGFENTSMITIV
jgi:hypothetical protein